tara:strand:+ start:1064 stop:1285 length:222 start_codon:yes stop_codon:yes gene_type:complete
MRDYKKEYNTYHGKPEQRKRRSSRNKARRIAVKKYGKQAVSGKDVDHKDRNPMNNSRRNLRIQSKSSNRARNK